MTFLRMTDLDLAGKRALIREGEAGRLLAQAHARLYLI